MRKYRRRCTNHKVGGGTVKMCIRDRLKAPLDIYLKVNSGMNRLGFQPDRVLTVWQQLRAMANVGEMTPVSYTHLAVYKRQVIMRVTRYLIINR